MTITGLDRGDLRWVAALVPPLAVRVYGDAAGTAVQRLLLLALSMAIAYAWAALFARSGGRPLGRGLPAFAVTFVLLLPAEVAWDSAAVALSFGAVFGREAFGGRGLLPPALVALAFAIFSFPGGGFELHEVLARPPDLLFAASCLPGAALLALRGALAWEVAAGAVAGAVLTGFLLGGPAWWLHPGLGTFAAAVLFLAAASESAAEGSGARWLHGVLVGALIATIRVATPTHPDGVVFAALLGALFAPLLGRALRWRPSHA